VLEAAYEAGLSGPRRLHDLFVETTAVTPGEYKSGGQGLDVCYGVHQTPFGYCAIALTPRGVCSLAFLEDRDPAQFAAVLHADWPQAHVCEDQARTAPWVQRIFSPATHRAPIPAVLHGTNFQIQVWEALLRIPTGTVTSYESLAQAIGKPEATRAVASAVAHNRIAFVIPCHRVIRKIGEAGEYRWGRARKRALLGWEASQRTGESS